MPDNPEHVRQHFRGEAMSIIQAELANQARMLRVVRQGLPDFLGGHCQHCVVEGNRLLIYSDSPAFAYQLRFYGPSLLSKIEEATGQRFQDVRIRNLLPAGPAQAYEKPHVFVPPSPSVGVSLRESAENSPHEEIREALLRLSRAVEEASKGKPEPATPESRQPEPPPA